LNAASRRDHAGHSQRRSQHIYRDPNANHGIVSGTSRTDELKR
jgi:hypothetical protein